VVVTPDLSTKMLKITLLSTYLSIPSITARIHFTE